MSPALSSSPQLLQSRFITSEFCAFTYMFLSVTNSPHRDSSFSLPLVANLTATVTVGVEVSFMYCFYFKWNGFLHGLCVSIPCVKQNRLSGVFFLLLGCFGIFVFMLSSWFLYSVACLISILSMTMKWSHAWLKLLSRKVKLLSFT